MERDSAMRAEILVLFLSASLGAQMLAPGWRLISSFNGALEPPNAGTEQTSCAVLDIDGDKINDFVITERTAAPGVVWYRRTAQGWKRYVVDAGKTLIEAGSAYLDVDGDGDLDFVAGGESRSNQVWWWENPAPDFDPAVPWKRHLIKNSGANKHHDLMFADVDGDARPELLLWNQGGQKLLLARIPPDPREAVEWPITEIYRWSRDSEMQQRGVPPAFRQTNEHEGLAFADIDGDGVGDIVGGGLWFKRLPDGSFLPNTVDGSYHFSRSAAGQLKEGGRPEIVLSAGDGTGPLLWYEWVRGTWIAHRIADLDNGHSLALLDFDHDGHLDIFSAEMRLNGGNPESKTRIFFGDGQGNFTPYTIATGLDNHESKIADLDGDGDLDILAKPYNFRTPSLVILLNEGARR
jgi:hypothetical protein